MLQEHYERLPHKAIFDRLDLVCAFKAGKGNKGAIFSQFIESIYMHDEIAKQIDEKLDRIEELKKVLMKKQRVFRNWDSSYKYVFLTSFICQVLIKY